MLYFNNIFTKYICGLLEGFKRIYINYNFFNIHILLYFLKYNSMLKLTSLTDIITIDYLYEYKNRFEIIHIF